MENMHFKKSELLAVLKANRKRHYAIFLEACDGYTKKAVELIEQRLEMAKSGKRVGLSFSLAEPVNQTRDYDRAIKMLEMTTAATIVLSEGDFSQYVMDDWHWKRQFLASNMSYSETAASAFVALSGDE